MAETPCGSVHENPVRGQADAPRMLKDAARAEAISGDLHAIGLYVESNEIRLL